MKSDRNRVDGYREKFEESKKQHYQEYKVRLITLTHCREENEDFKHYLENLN